jgi:hypothetical protein
VNISSQDQIVGCDWRLVEKSIALVVLSFQSEDDDCKDLFVKRQICNGSIQSTLLRLEVISESSLKSKIRALQRLVR